jgi:hypothetical protein
MKSDTREGRCKLKFMHEVEEAGGLKWVTHIDGAIVDAATEHGGQSNGINLRRYCDKWLLVVPWLLPHWFLNMLLFVVFADRRTTKGMHLIIDAKISELCSCVT